MPRERVLHTARRLACPTLAEQAAHTTLATPPDNLSGFLTGRAGTALVLADLLPQPADPWDCLLLLS
ncbi:hypothetical protein AB0O01_00285 [Streptomyces sp. NPDC093252]|uniref:hypothetical protein n=1 Tax=Streptomyces sp. NPDC093252 TaxID=3154980 RepID=UPI00343C8E66